MKRLILFELIVLFLATTFESDSPPGWYQQVIPRNDVTIQDIFFQDSLTGHIVTRKNTNDSAFIFKTTDGGNNWILTLSQNVYLTSLQFASNNTGYSVGSAPGGIIKKTTNTGLNWYTVNVLAPYPLTDLSFVNNDTGWVCSDDLFSGGIYKTINGGLNWQNQLGASYSIRKMFFINKDTGWAGSADWKLYKTVNGGSNWSLQYTSNGAVESIFFLNNQKGWIRGGTGNGVAYTTDGGLSWQSAQGENAGFDIKFMNDSIGYAGGGNQPLRITKSTDGGKTWGYQSAQVTADIPVAILKGDTLRGWAGRQLLVRTTDGGGPIIYTGIGINPNSGVVPSFELKQNYPNPFNPSTKIVFDVTRNSKISLRIFNMLGEEIDELIDYEKHSAGTYKVSYEADNEMPSGVYFYQITAWTENGKEIFIDSRKMILLK